MNEVLKLPDNWNQIPRNERIRILAETVPINIDSLPACNRIEIEENIQWRADWYLFGTKPAVERVAIIKAMIGELKGVEYAR